MDLWNEDGEAPGFEKGLEVVEGAVELDCADECDGCAGREIAREGSEEVGVVDLDVDENIEGGDLRGRDGDEAAVGVVHEKVAAKSASSIVIYTAGAVGYVAHYQSGCARAEMGNDVGDGG